MELLLQKWVLSLLPFALGTIAAENFEQNCAALASRLNVVNTTVYFSQYLAADSTFATPDTNVTCGSMFMKQSVKVDLCRVAAYTTTSARSGVNFETWLPKNWSGRFISHGNGGLSGCMLLWELYDDTLFDW
jgi:feruloyl esterase